MRNIVITVEMNLTPIYHKIDAIKHVRSVFGWGLKESKHFVENLADVGMQGLRYRVTDRQFGRLSALTGGDLEVRLVSAVFEDMDYCDLTRV